MRPTRLVTLDDAPALTELVRVNREFLAPWDPVRTETYFTIAGQLKLIRTGLERHKQGASCPYVIIDPEDGRVVGRINLNGIVRGSFQSANLGYWVSAKDNGRGLATAAVDDIKQVAFAELGLHRIEAGTLTRNIRSQRVLEHNGFTRFGLAPSYLRIAGEWQDHIMFQVINDDCPEISAE
jgi:[ribosomal protein S5]-alanine N-acetyltransferase